MLPKLRRSSPPPAPHGAGAAAGIRGVAAQLLLATSLFHARRGFQNLGCRYVRVREETLRPPRPGASADASGGSPAPPRSRRAAARPANSSAKESRRRRSARWRRARESCARACLRVAALRWLALVAAAPRRQMAALLGLLTAAHARTWSAAPLLETSTRQATTWVFGENRWDDQSEGPTSRASPP